MDLMNCPRCGKLCAKNFRDVCPACIREIDKEYERCADHLRKNRGATTIELSEATDVTVRQISKFIREGRISMIGAPNLTYPCESCTIPIREGNLCLDCRSRLLKAIDSTMASEKKLTDDQRRAAAATYQIEKRD